MARRTINDQISDLEATLAERKRTLLLVGDVAHRQKAAMIGYVGIDPSPEGGWEMYFGGSYDEIATQCLLLPRYGPVG